MTGYTTMGGFPLNDWSQFKLKNHFNWSQFKLKHHFIFNVSMFYKDKHNARPKFESQILRPKRDTYLIFLMDREIFSLLC